MHFSPFESQESREGIALHEAGHALCYLTEKHEEIPLLDYGVGTLSFSLRNQIAKILKTASDMLETLEHLMEDGPLQEPLPPSCEAVICKLVDDICPKAIGYVDDMEVPSDNLESKIRILLAGQVASEFHQPTLGETLDTFIEFTEENSMKNPDYTIPYWHISTLVKERYDRDLPHHFIIEVEKCIHRKISNAFSNESFRNALEITQEHFMEHRTLQNIKSLLSKAAPKIARYTAPIHSMFTGSSLIYDADYIHAMHRIHMTVTLLEKLQDNDFPFFRLQEMGEQLRDTVDIAGVLEVASTANDTDIFYRM